MAGDVTYQFVHQDDGIVSYMRGKYVFAYNFSPTNSYTDYGVPAVDGSYKLRLSDDSAYGGQDRVEHMAYAATAGQLQLYIPARTALVLSDTHSKNPPIQAGFCYA